MFVFQISHLIHTCKVNSVDLTLMFESKTIGLCGFLEDVSTVRDSEIMKVAQQYTHVRRHARLMSKQVSNVADLQHTISKY